MAAPRFSIRRNGSRRASELAKQYAYAAPVSLGKNPVLLTREYETNARNIARSQAALCGGQACEPDQQRAAISSHQEAMSN